MTGTLPPAKWRVKRNRAPPLNPRYTITVMRDIVCQAELLKPHRVDVMPLDIRDAGQDREGHHAPAGPDSRSPDIGVHEIVRFGRRAMA